MSVTTVKSALKSLVTGTTGVANVYDRIRHFSTVDDIPVSGGVAQWWEVYLDGIQLVEIANNLVYAIYTFNIDGYYAISADTTSQATFENLAEAVVNKILADLDTGGTTEFGDFPEYGVKNCGLPVVKFGIALRMHAASALHQVRITIPVRDVTPKTIAL